MTTYYDAPDDRAGTVFDETSPTFGPIMSAIQAGDFADAAELLRALEPARQTLEAAALERRREYDRKGGRP